MNQQLIRPKQYEQQIKVYHINSDGTFSVITNSSGSIVEQTFYEPFGGIVSGGNTSRFYYEGKEFSPIINEYDYNFRKYNLLTKETREKYQ